MGWQDCDMLSGLPQLSVRGGSKLNTNHMLNYAGLHAESFNFPGDKMRPTRWQERVELPRYTLHFRSEEVSIGKGKQP